MRAPHSAPVQSGQSPVAPANRGSERLVRRLERFLPLDAEEVQVLAGCISRERRFKAREHLVHECSPAEGVFVLVSGFACRYKMSRDGRRQIVGILVPGDVCGLRVLLRRRMDHSVCALKQACASLIRAEAATGLLEQRPHLARAFWWMTTVDDAITREWLVNVGYRTASERVAHLLCEIFWRLEAVGLACDGQCEMPLTQIELGDALALSSVHVNRTLMEMRRSSLIRLHSGRLHILDRAALEAAACFDPQYLRLDEGVASPGGAEVAA